MHNCLYRLDFFLPIIEVLHNRLDWWFLKFWLWNCRHHQSPGSLRDESSHWADWRRRERKLALELEPRLRPRWRVVRLSGDERDDDFKWLRVVRCRTAVGVTLDPQRRVRWYEPEIRLRMDWIGYGFYCLPYTRVARHKKICETRYGASNWKKLWRGGVLLATDYGGPKYFYKLCRCYGRGLWRKGLP